MPLNERQKSDNRREIVSLLKSTGVEAKISNLWKSSNSDNDFMNMMEFWLYREVFSLLRAIAPNQQFDYHGPNSVSIRVFKCKMHPRQIQHTRIKIRCVIKHDNHTIFHSGNTGFLKVNKKTTLDCLEHIASTSCVLFEKISIKIPKKLS